MGKVRMVDKRIPRPIIAQPFSPKYTNKTDLLQFFPREFPRDGEPDEAERHPHRAEDEPDHRDVVVLVIARAVQVGCRARSEAYQEEMPGYYPDHAKDERLPRYAGDAEDVIQHPEGY